MFAVSAVRRRVSILLLSVLLVAGVFWFVEDRAGAGVPGPTGIDLVFVAVATNFPDALGVGPIAAATNAPILLVPTNPPLPQATADELVRLEPKNVAIIGGEAVISPAMEAAIQDLLPSTNVNRLGGADRYETNASLTEILYPIEGWATVMAPAFIPANSSLERQGSALSVWNFDTGDLVASIQLPHGAEVLEMYADVYDGDAGADVTIELRRHTGTDQSQAMTEVSSSVGFSGGETTIADTNVAFLNERVDNEEYSYYLVVTGADGPDMFVRNVRIKYRLGTLG